MNMLGIRWRGLFAFTAFIVFSVNCFLLEVNAFQSVYHLLPYDVEALSLIKEGINALENGQLDRGEEILGPFAESGDRHLQERLGFALMEEKDGEWFMTGRALKWWRMLAERHDPMAQTLVGSAYYNGEGVEKDFLKAINWTQKAAEVWYCGAQHNLGTYYQKGAQGYPPDPTKALEWFEKAADQGYAESQFAVCKAYDSDKRLSIELEKAFKYCELAANQGHSEAQFYLGSMYEHGDGAKQSYEESAKWYLKAAEKGNLKAQYNLGVFYYQGKGVQKSHEKALYWWEMAAAQGHSNAEGWLDEIYPSIVEDGVKAFDENNFELAFSLLESAAKKGFVEAQVKLGQMYARGDYVAQDDKRAFEWLRRAAAQGNAQGLELLGMMYLNGRGVEKNFEKGKNLILYSAAKGSPLAAKVVEKIFSGFRLAFYNNDTLNLISYPVNTDQDGRKWFWRKIIILKSDENDTLTFEIDTFNLYTVADCYRKLSGEKQINDLVIADNEIIMRPFPPGSIGQKTIDYACTNKD